ncbi:hypothetical protein KAU51_04835 [Candidatus Parcubacteria bacterium]|nr:hypothetical protein [Candidatus Parcubacteria bacterium]
MGRDYQPKVIFGLKIPRGKVIDESKVLSNDCVCDPKMDHLINPGTKFCSQCGRCINRLIKKYTPKFEGFDDVENDEENLNIEGWPVAFDTDAYNFYVGFYVQNGPYGHSGDKKYDFPDMSKMEQFKSDMKRIGLWDEEMFGVWLVLYLSC